VKQLGTMNNTKLPLEATMNT